MIEKIRTLYKVKEILAAIPADHGELFIGYKPAAVPGKWQEQFSQTLMRQSERRLYRSIFEMTGNLKSGVVVEVAECASAQDAVEDLMEILADNQLATLDPGPKSLQPAAFQHPKQAPGGLFFTRANLRISIMSQSGTSDNIDEWLSLIQQDLDLSPDDARSGLVIRSVDTQKNVTGLNYNFPWKIGPDGWLKFVSKGTTIKRGEKSGQLVVDPIEAVVTVKGWVLERERENYMGEFISTADR